MTKKEGKERHKWICSRCAQRKDIEAEIDPVVLRVCDWCNIENWVKPVGHAGANAGGGRVMPVKYSAQGERLPLYKKRKKKAPSVAAVEEPLVEIEEEVKEPLQEESPEETAVEEVVAETVEEAVAEQLEPEGEVAETNIAKTLDEQIAELEAKKKELEK